MSLSADLPRIPGVVSLPLRGLPLAPLSLALSALTRRLSANHPGLFRRLGVHGRKRFLVDPIDLPLTLLLDLSDPKPRVTAHRTPPSADCRIAGPLSALLGMVHGTLDGDALFFSRDLVLEGDTAAALALRNAIDDAELDLAREVTELAGALGRPLTRLLPVLESLTHLPLRRVDGEPV
ncbi:MAG: SCP2 sterol-binding domain-containing protein [Rhodospirillum sp.]|nr:SCP2 sterol-binding domain-containing protein [Rhodospirillum sp.]MCF8491129.1 SCP2 sterol-binding domain-containing protein [Rhodospirillum sp.]MCF8501661.1 SCP2 sterol-binding domain-containing protein [Rhodospirillum sp.]